MSKHYFHIGRGIFIIIILVIIAGHAFLPVFGYSGANPFDTPEPISKSQDTKSFAEKKRILVLHSYHEGYIWTDRITQGMQKVLSPYSNVELFINYMDTKRYTDSLYFSRYADVLEIKYQHHNFDAVILCDDNALNFHLQYHERLFPDIPVVFCGINDFTPDRIKGYDNYTGVMESYEEEGTLELILDLHPETEDIIFITDNTTSGQLFKDRMIRAEKTLPAQTRIKYIHNKSPEEIKDVVKGASEHTVFLWGIYLRTPEGTALTLKEGVQIIKENTQLPVYCIWDVVGYGVIGGKITSPEFQGEKTAKLVLRIFNGEKPGDIEVSPSPVVYKFDFHELKKLNLDYEDLPQESILINEPFSIYKAYRKQINRIIAFVIFLIVVISILFIFNRRLIKTENELTNKNSELHKKTILLADTNLRLEAAMEKAQESDKLKTTFLANLSHEIRTPMNGILGFTTLLKKEDVSKKDRKRYLDIISQSGHRMLSIINDLIDISKIESGQVKLYLQDVDVKRVGTDALNFFTPKAEEKGLTLEYHPEENKNECIINTDKGKLEQILYNLIKNALKFTKSGGVNFGYSFTNNSIEFYVIDTGPGIPSEYQRIIFERFRQVDDSTRREEEGSGLGLAISKAYVDMLGGKIEVISEEGKGSKFFFSIPCHKKA